MSGAGRATGQLSAEIAALSSRIAALDVDSRGFEAALRCIDDAVIVTDAEGVIARLNRAAEGWTGWSEAQAAGRLAAEVFGIVDEETGAEIESPVASALRDGTGWGRTEHAILIGRDGTPRPIVHEGAPILGAAGGVIGAVVVFRTRDLAERERAEHALAASEMRYRRLFEAAKDGILILDAVSGAIVDVNPFLVSLTGFSREEFLGRHLWEIGPFKDIAASAALFLELQDREYVRYEDLPLETRDGRRIEVEFVSNVYIVEDQKVIQCNVRDVSARKLAEKERERLEEQLKASQKLEAIGGLAAGVAHDFNNLLTVILSYTGFALNQVREGDPLRDDLLEVKKGGERAAALTRQLLAFSRKQVLQAVPLSLNQIAEGIEKMLRRILGEDIDFVQALAPDLGVVRADPGQMEQVLMNLVVNARDAMPVGGQLTIETSNIEIDEEYAERHVAVRPGPYVQLAVTDTGSGMDRETMARIFEPFFTTKGKGKGSGLGLSMVYGIVKQSGGNIWVYSEPGQGTTFKIYLPRELSAAAVTGSRPPATPTRVTGTETVLVVEDEPALCEAARRALDAAGYRVLTAANGDEALLIFQEHVGDIHLLLTDVVMPRMSGRALAQELTKRRPTLKVLYMSGYTDDAIVHHGVLHAGTHFLPKPFTGGDLARKVREVLDGDGRERAGDASDGLEERSLDRAALGALPRELLGKLGKAVTAARYDELLELVEAIGLTEPALAIGLRRMVDRFDYDGIRELLGR